MATEGMDPSSTILTPDTVKKALRAVKDPELGLNIIDIGLVYEAIVSDQGDVTVKMTLTSPGCPAGAEIMGDAKLVLEDLEIEVLQFQLHRFEVAELLVQHLLELAPATVAATRGVEVLEALVRPVV